MQFTPLGKPLLDTENNSCTISSLVFKAATLCNHTLNFSAGPCNSQWEPRIGNTPVEVTAVLPTKLQLEMR